MGSPDRDRDNVSRVYRLVALGLGQRFRRRRWARVLEAFPDLSTSRVLDLGGELGSWDTAPVTPRCVTVVNPLVPDAERPGFRSVRGDGCDLPGWLREETFDLVFSNSVLEHVGGADRRRAFARTVQEMAPRHWIQTPYRYFPVEPHWLVPGMAWLPLRARAAISRTWPFGFPRERDQDSSVSDCLSVDLLTRTEMRYLFPASTQERERFLGLTKSLIAVLT
jgi:hypothetical protein